MNEDDELAEQYRVWTAESVGQMRAIIDAAANAAEFSPEAQDEMHGLAHNIKGMGTSFDYQLMTDVGALLCTYLMAIRAGRAKMDIAVVEGHIKAFEVVIEHDIKGDGGERGGALVERLKALASGGA